MKYADLRAKKMAGMLAIAVMLGGFVSGTAALWAKEIGTFSISSVELAVSNAFSPWPYRLQFYAQFGAKPAQGSNPLLAALGLMPPAASSPPTADTAARQAAIPVLLYHGILPESESSEVTAIATFKAQMFALKHAGWQ